MGDGATYYMEWKNRWVCIGKPLGWKDVWKAKVKRAMHSVSRLRVCERKRVKKNVMAMHSVSKGNEVRNR
jgi:hypothetical protein